jgi:cholesterol transport system auxiliary component
MLPRPLLLLALAPLAACSLTSKSTPLDIHYFSPESAAAPEPPALPAARAATTLELGRVTSSASLRSRIAHRDSAFRIGLYETRRWTDDPDVYVRRALTRELFDRGAFARAVDGRHPILDVEVVAFEAVTTGPSAAGRVVLRYELHDDRAVLTGGVVSATRPAEGTDFEAIVAAISAALDEATANLVAAVAPEAREAAEHPPLKQR